MAGPLFTVREAAEEYGMPISRILRAIRGKRLKARFDGYRYLINRKVFKKAIEFRVKTEIDSTGRVVTAGTSKNLMSNPKVKTKFATQGAARQFIEISKRKRK